MCVRLVCACVCVCVFFFMMPTGTMAVVMTLATQIGRKRPDEADSDMDDAMSEDSDEEWEDVDHSDGVSERRI